jgi:dephospho-CoA kinase
MPSPMSCPQNTKPVIGLVGGIGSGKSTVAAELAALGCAVIDADELGHLVLSAPAVRRKVRARWSESVFDADGQVDRAALGRIVFSDGDELAALTAMVHPGIERLIGERIATAQADASVPAIVLDAAVLFEAGWDACCSDLVFVAAPRPQRLARVHDRRGWTDQELAAREKAQIPLDIKAAKCHHSLDNSSTAECLQGQVRRLFRQIVHVAGRP